MNSNVSYHFFVLIIYFIVKADELIKIGYSLIAEDKHDILQLIYLCYATVHRPVVICSVNANLILSWIFFSLLKK